MSCGIGNIFHLGDRTRKDRAVAGVSERSSGAEKWVGEMGENGYGKRREMDMAPRTYSGVTGAVSIKHTIAVRQTVNGV